MGQKGVKEVLYLAGVVVMGLALFLILRSQVKRNRKVFACPVNFGASCSNLEAEYESTCFKGEECMYYYTKLILPNKQYVVFDYCEDTGRNIQTCYVKDSDDAWMLEYKGKSVVRD